VVWGNRAVGKEQIEAQSAHPVTHPEGGHFDFCGIVELQEKSALVAFGLGS
jgi:hypothetical protein